MDNFINYLKPYLVSHIFYCNRKTPLLDGRITIFDKFDKNV